MKQSLPLLVCLILLPVPSLLAQDYVITINGATAEISLDQETTLVLPDGYPLTLTLQRKEFSRFNGDFFSFEHKSIYQPNRNDLGDGIFQTMIVTPLGTGLLVQEYMQLNPSSLIDLMLNELTKEEVEYGYEYHENPVQRTLNGIILEGKQAITTYSGEEWTREVLSYGEKDRGILIITFIEADNYGKDQDLLDFFWNSLQLSSDF